jgi:hypothetical protein
VSMTAMTPLCISHGVYDSVVHVTAVSMILLCMSQMCQWNRHGINCWIFLWMISNTFLCRNLTRLHMEHGMTPLLHAQRYHWYSCDMHI